MSDLPWVKPGWAVRVRAKTGSAFQEGKTEIVGTVSQVDTDHAKWFRVGCMETSYFVAYGDIDSIQILDSSFGFDEERVR